MVGFSDLTSVSKENIEVMDALVGNFTLFDDVNKVYEIHKGYRKLAHLCKEKEEDIKEAVRQLASSVQTLESQSSTYGDKHTVDERQTQLAELRRALDSAKTSSGDFQKKIDDAHDAWRAVTAQHQDVEERNIRTKKESADTESRLKHELSLYAHISKISWKQADAGVVSGVVSKVKKGDLKGFKMNANDSSRYELTNALWDLMDD